MNLDAVIAIGKIAAAVVAGVLGVLGVLVNFKRDDGRVTRWGYAVITGILVSAFIGVATQVGESYRAQRDSQEQTAKTQHLLEQLNRSIQPITRVHVSAVMTFPRENESVARYVARMEKGIHIQRLLPKLNSNIIAIGPSVDYLSAGVTDAQGKAASITIGEKSSLWPRREDERTIASAIRSLHLDLFMYRKPIKVAAFSGIISVGHGHADWIATGFILGKRSTSLDFDLATRTLSVHYLDDPQKEFMHSNGRIVSLVDLRGSQLFILPPGIRDYQLPERFQQMMPNRKALEQLYGGMDIKYAVLSFANGREIWLHRSKLSRQTFAGGEPVYAVVLPATEEEFLKLETSTN